MVSPYNAFDEWYHHAINGMIGYLYVINVMFSIIRLVHCLCWLVSSCNVCADQVSSCSAWVDRYHHELYALICNAGIVWFLSAMHGLDAFIMHCMQWKLSSCTTCNVWYHHAMLVRNGVMMQCMWSGIIMHCLHWWVPSCNDCDGRYFHATLLVLGTIVQCMCG